MKTYAYLNRLAVNGEPFFAVIGGPGHNSISFQSGCGMQHGDGLKEDSVRRAIEWIEAENKKLADAQHLSSPMPFGGGVARDPSSKT